MTDSLGVNELRAGQTVAIDFKELRDSQTPDGTGRIIPLNLDTGQIAWSARGMEDKVLSGRSEQISLSGGVASTYSCYNCCQDSVFQTSMTPFSPKVWAGDSTQMLAQQRDINCMNQIVGPYIPDTIAYYSTNSQIASVDVAGAALALSAGYSNVGGTWDAVTWVNNGISCQAYQENVDEQVFMEVAPVVQVTEVGFSGDHLITKWPASTPANVIDSSDGTVPTWKSANNPNDPVAYTKGGTATLFAKLTIGSTIPNTNAKIRVKNGSTVITANKDVVLSGGSITVTGISTTSALESTVKKTTPTFTWEISYNGGSSWRSIGSSGPHTMYWTYATPLSPSFKNDAGMTYAPLYDLALQKATGYANGTSDLSTIISRSNTGVDGDINYQPSTSIFDKHPLDAYATQGGCQCSDLANLLRGLLRSIGIDGTTTYIWAGSNSSTLRRYTVTSTGSTNPSFRIARSAHDSAGANPHFKFHAVVSANSAWYDPSYGLTYGSLSFTETADNNTPQQTSSTPWSSEVISSFACPH